MDEHKRYVAVVEYDAEKRFVSETEIGHLGRCLNESIKIVGVQDAKEPLNILGKRHIFYIGRFRIRVVVGGEADRLQEVHHLATKEWRRVQDDGVRAVPQALDQVRIITFGCSAAGNFFLNGCRHGAGEAVARREHAIHGSELGIEPEKARAVVVSGVVGRRRISIQVPTHEIGGHGTAHGMASDEYFLPPDLGIRHHGLDHLEYVFRVELQSEL